MAFHAAMRNKYTRLLSKMDPLSSVIPLHSPKPFECHRNISFVPDAKKTNDLPIEAKKWGCLGFSRGSKFATGFSALAPKTLESIIDFERAKKALPEELSTMWNEGKMQMLLMFLQFADCLKGKKWRKNHGKYHIGRGHVSTTLTSKQYYLLAQRSSSCMYFVIPLWRGSGYTSMFVQAGTPYMLFTGLEDYKVRGTQASPYLTATYYKEFAETKGLVLVRGDIVFTSKLSDEEASRLLETTESFYLNDSWYKLVEQFNREPGEFEFNNVLRTLEMPSG